MGVRTGDRLYFVINCLGEEGRGCKDSRLYFLIHCLGEGGSGCKDRR